MSNYSGPGLYEIIPYHAQDKSLNIYGGGPAAGGKLIIYDKSTNSTNAQFEIAAAGGTHARPEKGDREYHIIPNNSGLYLTWHPLGGTFTQDLKPPTDAAVRFKLDNSSPNGTFLINNIDGTLQMNVRGGATASGTEVISYSPSNASTHCQFIIRAIQ